MNIISTMTMACTLAIAGCGGNSSTETTTVATGRQPVPLPTTDEPGTSCAHEVALVCAEGQIDACLKDPDAGNFHKCVPR